MDTRFKENMILNPIYKLAIPLLCGSLLAITFLAFSAKSSYAASPTILTVSPSESPNNFDTIIVITGTDFQVVISGTSMLTVPVVRLGEHELQLEGLATTRTLTATVPWGFDEGVYPIQIENSDGTSVTLANAFTMTAALGVWATGGPYGGTVCHLEMDEIVTSTLYAQLGDLGLFKTENSGVTWRNVFPGYMLAHIGQFTLKPGEPQTIYLSGSLDGGDKLYRSTNGGEDWHAILEYGR